MFLATGCGAARALAIAGLTALIATAAYADAMDDIRSDCAIDWPGDYNMQEFCIGRQVEAARKIQVWIDQFATETEEYRILERCFGEWQTERGTFDYAMIHFCTDRQLAAYRRLRGG